MLQVNVFRMAGDFFSERSKEDHEQWVRPQRPSRDTIQDNFPILTIKKFYIELIKLLFHSVVKVMRN